jgi:trigger factor
VLTSQQYGIEPQQLLGYMQQNNQLPAMFADVRRGLTIAEVVEAATVTDTDGNAVDTEEFFGKRSKSGAEDDGETADAGEAAASSEEPSGDTK